MLAVAVGYCHTRWQTRNETWKPIMFTYRSSEPTFYPLPFSLTFPAFLNERAAFSTLLACFRFETKV